MEDDSRLLVPMFLEHVREPGREDLRRLPELEPRLRQLLADARAAWPGVRLTDGVFLGYLAERLPAAERPEDRLRVDARELYVVCAAAAGDQDALLAFEKVYFPIIDAALSRLRLAPADVDEVKQTLRCRLFVAEPGARAKIHEYAGQGDLQGLVRVAAVRTAISMLRLRAREEPAVDEALLRLPASEPDPEIQHLRSRHAEAFKAAFQEAVARLSSRERNLLRMHVLDRLTVEQIAVLYGVHRATMTRWLTAARQSVLAHTRRLLGERLRLGPNELDRFVHSIASQLDLSLARVLARDQETDTG